MRDLEGEMNIDLQARERGAAMTPLRIVEDSRVPEGEMRVGPSVLLPFRVRERVRAIMGMDQNDPVTAAAAMAHELALYRDVLRQITRMGEHTLSAHLAAEALALPGS